MTDKKVIIGLEVHVQPATQTKVFCSCALPPKDAEPNTYCCDICLGHPGSKPMLNEAALRMASKIALGLNCQLLPDVFFSRKTYFYPDMSKNYQITQFEAPLAVDGILTLKSGKKVRLKRVHLEEDPARLVHKGSIASADYVLVDYNRSGVPLVEIVTEPDFSEAAETREFLDSLLNILDYLEVFNPQQGVMKVDANISLEGGERVEIKNITGAKEVEKALAFEVVRQRNQHRFGKEVVRETRAYDETSGQTVSLRSKETEEDYGYIADPDLPLVSLSKTFVSSLQATMPELPEAKVQRFVKSFKLKEYDARVLAGSGRELADLFEALSKRAKPELVASALTRDLLSILNHDNLSLKKTAVESTVLLKLLKLLEGDKITQKVFKDALIQYVSRQQDPIQWIEANKLLKVAESKDLKGVVESVLKANAKAAADFKAGQPKALEFLIGQVVRQTKGTADVKVVREQLLKALH